MKNKLLTKKQKYGIDRYLQGGFAAGRFAIEEALNAYEAVKENGNSFQEAMQLVAVIQSHCTSMYDILKISEKMDKIYKGEL